MVELDLELDLELVKMELDLELDLELVKLGTVKSGTKKLDGVLIPYEIL